MYSILQGVFKDPQGEVTFLKKILGKAVTLLPPPPLLDASVVKYSQTPSVISHRVIKAVKLNMHIGSIYAAYIPLLRIFALDIMKRNVTQSLNKILLWMLV